MAVPPSGPHEGRDDADDLARKQRPAWWAILAWLLAVVAVLLAFARTANAAQALPVLLLLGLAALAIGGLIGFLFGIPSDAGRDATATTTRLSQSSAGSAESLAASVSTAVASPASSTSRADRGNYQPPNSLEQIAGWLTKILIGAGLVELHAIGDALGRLGAMVAGAAGGQPTNVGLAAQAVVVGFSVTGFVGSYLWTRLHYGVIQVSVDQSIYDMVQRFGEDVKDTKRALQPIAERVLTSERATSWQQQESAREVARAARQFPVTVSEKIDRFREEPVDWNRDSSLDIFGPTPSEQRGRRLEAVLLAKLESALVISLRVVRVGGEPLQGSVVFLLHPSFDQRMIEVPVRGQVAEETIYAAGGFTAIAIADDGHTLLGYDLAKLPGAPQWFRDS